MSEHNRWTQPGTSHGSKSVGQSNAQSNAQPNAQPNAQLNPDNFSSQSLTKGCHVPHRQPTITSGWMPGHGGQPLTWAPLTERMQSVAVIIDRALFPSGALSV
jgi:hypothetical protein